jgi:DNA polymerase-3 subunit alpha
MSKFAHLHVHSHYSLLEAVPKISDLVKRAVKDGAEALALTDSGNLYGAIEFYKECKDAGLKPIIGIDAYMAARSRTDKEARIDNVRSRLVLLAENEAGYKDLLKLVTESYLTGFYYKPRLDREVLEKHKDGLIAISPSFSGEIIKALGGHDPDKAEEICQWYKSVFGDKFYIEITHHPEIAGHEERMRNLIEFAKKHAVPIVAAHDVYYLDPKDRAARDMVLSIQSHLGSRDGSSFGDEEEDFSLLSEKEMKKRFKDTPEALENAAKIADMCSLDLTLGSWVFPDYRIESGKTADEELRDRVMKGFATREMEKSEENMKRTEYELGVIRTKGYSAYFLVVADLLAFDGILSNIRGSVSGSMVTYLAGITTSTRSSTRSPSSASFNPDRPSAPDIDMDFADNRRDEVIEYARRSMVPTTWPRSVPSAP